MARSCVGTTVTGRFILSCCRVLQAQVFGDFGNTCGSSLKAWVFDGDVQGEEVIRTVRSEEIMAPELVGAKMMCLACVVHRGKSKNSLLLRFLMFFLLV